MPEPLPVVPEPAKPEVTPEIKPEPAKVEAKPEAEVKPPVKEEVTEPEVKTRRTPKDFIIERLQKKAEKMEKKPEADDEVAPEDEELINRVVSKKFAPLLEKTIAEEDAREVSDFLTENPDFKPYEGKVRQFMSHPSRRHLPVSSIFYEVAGKDLLKLGAKRSQEADEKAKHTQAGGGSGEGGVDKKVWEMTPAEFEAEKERVRRG